jgi:hypothetical protein
VQHVRLLGELDALVAGDLDAVAPRIEEVEVRALEQRGTRRFGERTHAAPLVDDQPNVPMAVRRPRLPFHQGQELIAPGRRRARRRPS